MLTLSFDRRHGVARLKFTGLLTHDDLDMIDPLLVGVAGGAHGAIGPTMRCLYDMTVSARSWFRLQSVRASLQSAT